MRHITNERSETHAVSLCLPRIYHAAHPGVRDKSNAMQPFPHRRSNRPSPLLSAVLTSSHSIFPKPHATSLHQTLSRLADNLSPSCRCVSSDAILCHSIHADGNERSESHSPSLPPRRTVHSPSTTFRSRTNQSASSAASPRAQSQVHSSQNFHHHISESKQQSETSAARPRVHCVTRRILPTSSESKQQSPSALDS